MYVNTFFNVRDTLCQIFSHISPFVSTLLNPETVLFMKSVGLPLFKFYKFMKKQEGFAGNALPV